MMMSIQRPSTENLTYLLRFAVQIRHQVLTAPLSNALLAELVPRRGRIAVSVSKQARASSH